jgi:hypothetical protein
VAGSPVLGVLSVSLTSTRSSDPSHLFGLAGPTSLRLNRMDLPCSRCFLLVACWRYEPREHLRPLAIARAAIPPSPLRDRVGYSDHDRFRGYVPVHCRSGLQPPCLRFATTVTGRHARLGSQLLARLCRGRHLRRQTSTRLQGATRTDPYGPNSSIRLPPWMSNGEAILWPWMKDSRFREPVVGQPLDPLPSRPVFLAPLP